MNSGVGGDFRVAKQRDTRCYPLSPLYSMRFHMCLQLQMHNWLKSSCLPLWCHISSDKCHTPTTTLAELRLPPAYHPPADVSPWRTAVKTGATSVYFVHIRKCCFVFLYVLELIHYKSILFNTTLNTCDTGTLDSSTIPSQCQGTGAVSGFSLLLFDHQASPCCLQPQYRDKWPGNLVPRCHGSQSLSWWQTNHLLKCSGCQLSLVAALMCERSWWTAGCRWGNRIGNAQREWQSCFKINSLFFYF